MCKGKCTHPEKLKGTPQDCSEEQIRECHPDAKKHPCVEESKKRARMVGNYCDSHDFVWTLPAANI